MSEDEKKSLVRIDPASKTKESLLNIIDDGFSNYQEMNLTPEEQVRLNKTLSRLSTGASTFTILHCRGNACPFSGSCPLVKMNKSSTNPHGKAPVGNECILESTLLRDSLSSYIQEFDVDPKNYTEVNIVAELAEIEVLQWRINMQLSQVDNALLTVDQAVGFDKEGNAITRLEAHPLVDQKAKLSNRKSKLQKAMVGDRQEKYKKEAALKVRTTGDASSQMADVKRKIKELEIKTKTASESKIQEAEVLSPEEIMSRSDDE